MTLSTPRLEKWGNRVGAYRRRRGRRGRFPHSGRLFWPARVAADLRSGGGQLGRYAILFFLSASLTKRLTVGRHLLGWSKVWVRGQVGVCLLVARRSAEASFAILVLRS